MTFIEGITGLVKIAMEEKASDLHLSAGVPPSLLTISAEIWNGKVKSIFPMVSRELVAFVVTCLVKGVLSP